MYIVLLVAPESRLNSVWAAAPPPRNDMVRECYLPELVCQRMLRADVLNACATCVASRRHKCTLAHAYGYGAAYCAHTHTMYCISIVLVVVPITHEVKSASLLNLSI